MKSIENIIHEKLNEIERVENVKVLHAVESGSRAWGFASPDSDYDVRFLYVRPRDEYLKLNKNRDVIEYEQNEIYDINGWDIDKSLKLAHNSNPTLFEWLNSPVVYRTSDTIESLKPELEKLFQQRSAAHHYYNTALNTYKTYLKRNKVILKKYFYAIRPILALKWVLDAGTPPPVAFDELSKAELEENMREDLERLLEKKMATNEQERQHPDKVWTEWIVSNLETTKKLVEKLPTLEKGSWNEINKIFLKIIK